MSSIRTKRAFACVLRSPTLAVAAAFVLRMILLWLSHRGENPAHPRFETVGLEAQLLASSLAAGKGFFEPYPAYPTPTAWLAPAYPFLWSILEKLFHPDPSSSLSTVMAQTMNCLFSAATCWPIFAIGKRVFGRSVGLASAWLWVFLPYAVLLPLEWTWDQSLSALMLAWIVSLTFQLSESDSSLSLTGYGLLWALAALVNATLCVLLPFLLVWLLVRRSRLGWPWFPSAARVILIFVLALLPWTIRNYYAVDGLVFVKSNFGTEFWLGNNPAVKEVFSPERHPWSDRGELISLMLNGEPNYNRLKQRQAIAFIEAQPRVFLRNVSDRFKDTWAATYDSRADPWIQTLKMGRIDVWFCLFFSILSLAGMALALQSGWRDALPLAMCVVLFPIPYYITHTALRYRHPIDPFLTILTVYAVARFWRALVPNRPPERSVVSASEEEPLEMHWVR